MRLYNKDKWLDIINDDKYQQYRDLITNTFNELVFDEGPHKYYLHGKELTCVSNITHLFQEHFDEERMAEICEEKGKKDPNYKYAGMSKTEIIESWHENSRNACEHGTERHNFGESCLHFMIGDYDGIVPEFKDRLHTDENGDDYFESLYPKEDAVVTYWQDIPRCIVPILAENKVYDEDLDYSGTFDILFYYDAELDGKDSKKSGFYVMDYKGLDITTPILTTDGWKTMGTVKEGDIVFDKEGKQTKILHASQIHHRKCYKIKFDNNDEIICDNEHRWLISFLCEEGEYVEKVMTGEELYDYINGLDFKASTYEIPKIRLTKSVEEETGINVGPYELSILSIEVCETVPTRCIEVDSDSHTFLCGKNMLVTHNTNKDLYKNFNDKKLLEPFDFLLDMPLSIYKLQLSAYQNCLRKIGIKVIARALIWLKPDGTYEKIKLEEYVDTLVNALQERKGQYDN